MTSPEQIAALTSSNNSFSKETPGLQLHWDSTSLTLAKFCPRKYYFSMIEGWEPKVLADPLRFGLAFHKCVEEYEKKIATGVDYEAALFHATRIALEETLETDMETGELIPWKTMHPNRSRQALIRSVVWYIETYKNDIHKTLILSDGRPAVELSFSHATPYKICGQQTFKCGHLDKVTEIDERLWIMDYKTTKGQLNTNFFNGFSPANQMSFYTEAGSIIFNKPCNGVLIDGIGIGLKDATRFGRGFVHRTPNMIHEWSEDMRATLEAFSTYALKQHWPQNDTVCSMYGGCTFQEICNTDPSARHIYLESNFKRRVWDPTNPRN